MRDAFERNRDELFAAANRIVANRADAEDVMQDAWLSWRRLDANSIEDARPYLFRLVTRQAIDHLRRRAARRETGWDVDPAGLETEDAARATELADAVEAGLRIVLETLAPIERSVFLLHEVFGLTHEEIAADLGRTEHAVRQVAYRARRHVLTGRPRYRPTRSEHRSAVAQFRSVSAGGRIPTGARACGA
ncbi:sigma-70 family RNA polymerase sigma factor [Pseudonocardia acaciae]|uniref:sigma-70 family RNA polymerase sigma factor n=1 Tax=Pseudonocardia acaciae TaxID=551276 RepID=UPI000688CD9C|nr:sigma-70 family RNA polymerase sigma factor [Pseudonocardia acaciae]